MLQLRQFRYKGRDGRWLDPIDGQLEIEDTAVREVAITRVYLRNRGANRDGKRQISSGSLGAALDRRVDLVHLPAPAGATVVDDHRGAVDAERVQQAERRAEPRRTRQLLDHPRAEIGDGLIGC